MLDNPHSRRNPSLLIFLTCASILSALHFGVVCMNACNMLIFSSPYAATLLLDLTLLGITAMHKIANAKCSSCDCCQNQFLSNGSMEKTQSSDSITITAFWNLFHMTLCSVCGISGSKEVCGCSWQEHPKNAFELQCLQSMQHFGSMLQCKIGKSQSLNS